MSAGLFTGTEKELQDTICGIKNRVAKPFLELSLPVAYYTSDSLVEAAANVFDDSTTLSKACIVEKVLRSAIRFGHQTGLDRKPGKEEVWRNSLQSFMFAVEGIPAKNYIAYPEVGFYSSPESEALRKFFWGIGGDLETGIRRFNPAMCLLSLKHFILLSRILNFMIMYATEIDHKASIISGFRVDSLPSAVWVPYDSISMDAICRDVVAAAKDSFDDARATDRRSTRYIQITLPPIPSIGSTDNIPAPRLTGRILGRGSNIAHSIEPVRIEDYESISPLRITSSNVAAQSNGLTLDALNQAIRAVSGRSASEVASRYAAIHDLMARGGYRIDMDMAREFNANGIYPGDDDNSSEEDSTNNTP